MIQEQIDGTVTWNQIEAAVEVIYGCAALIRATRIMCLKVIYLDGDYGLDYAAIQEVMPAELTVKRFLRACCRRLRKVPRKEAWEFNKEFTALVNRTILRRDRVTKQTKEQLEQVRIESLVDFYRTKNYRRSERIKNLLSGSFMNERDDGKGILILTPTGVIAKPKMVGWEEQPSAAAAKQWCAQVRKDPDSIAGAALIRVKVEKGMFGHRVQTQEVNVIVTTGVSREAVLSYIKLTYPAASVSAL